MHRHSSILKQRTRGRLNVEKLTYGLIGCGRIAPNHITAAMNNADALEVVALCDPVREHAEKILSFLPEEKRASVRMYEDYREMLRDGAPTLVSIATESGKHASIGLDCLRCGMQRHHRKAHRPFHGRRPGELVSKLRKAKKW